MKARYPPREPTEKQESTNQVLQVEMEENTTEEGFTVVERNRRRSGRASPQPENQKKKKEEVEKKAVTGRKADEEVMEKEREKAIKKVDLQKEETVLMTPVVPAKAKDSEVQMCEGEMERLFRVEEGKTPVVEEEKKKPRRGKNKWNFVTYSKNKETEKKF
uniref:Uncharacterized protein n=1 Tax=Octopus bimaculoides TaxID=37653 RepID=A0A0L8IG95_OCTBM